MTKNPEQRVTDYSSGEWLDTLTLYKKGDQVSCPSKHGNKVFTITRIWPVSPGDYKLAQHSQYVELSDQHGIFEYSVSAAYLKPATTIVTEEISAKKTENKGNPPADITEEE